MWIEGREPRSGVSARAGSAGCLGWILFCVGCTAPVAEMPLGDELSAFETHMGDVLHQPVRVESLASGAVAVRWPPEAGVDIDPSIVLPSDPERAVELQFADGSALRVYEEGVVGAPMRIAQTAARERVDGRAYWTISAEGHPEEWLDLDEGVAVADRVAASWTIEGATLTPVPETHGVHVFVSHRRDPIYVAAPIAWAADGEVVNARLSVDGDRILLFVDGAGRRVLVDPVWVPTSAMTVARSFEEALGTAALVPGGVLIVGGTFTPSAERYDIATGVWSAVAPMSAQRGALVGLSDGRVLAAGGTGQAEVYDPALGTWALTGPTTARRNHAASRLLDGRVLVTGGADGPGTPLATADIFDPTTSTWSATEAFTTGRFWHASTTLADGRVMITGGSVRTSVTNSVQIFDPVGGSWSAGPSMSMTRCLHAAVLLPTGEVLVIGGRVASFVHTPTAELYDPVTNRWTATGSLATTRDSFTATLLPDGRVLVVGGDLLTGTAFRTSEIYSRATGTWTPGPMLTTARANHVATLLPGGRVLVAGPDASSEVLVEDSCGNGILNPGEGCDDGNRRNGDCCSGLCAIEPIGSVCRAGSGCDAAESCDGVTTACPPDGVALAGVVCRPASGACDVEDVCDGVTAACPDAFALAGVVCRPVMGVCDVEDTCDGGSPVCPPDGFLAADITCRAAVSECDLPESCAGTMPTCPSDLARPSGTSCGPALDGPCDVSDVCEGTVGTSAFCAPRWAAPGTECSVASCDSEVESSSSSCTGSTSMCPASSVRSCVPYACGTSSCLTSCGTSSDCAPGFECHLARCVPPRPDAGPMDAGVDAPVDAPVPIDAPILPLDAPLDGGAGADGGVDTGSPSVDTSVGPDAGFDAPHDASDVGESAPASAGCTCRAGRRGSPLAMSLALLFALICLRRSLAARG
jgi:cysteine-rich repeat protein